MTQTYTLVYPLFRGDVISIMGKSISGAMGYTDSLLGDADPSSHAREPQAFHARRLYDIASPFSRFPAPCTVCRILPVC